MKEKITNVKEIIDAEPMVPEFWKFFALFLLGVMVGFVFSPIKQGLSIASYNHDIEAGNDNSASCGDIDTDEDEDDD